MVTHIFSCYCTFKFCEARRPSLSYLIVLTLQWHTKASTVEYDLN